MKIAKLFRVKNLALLCVPLVLVLFVYYLIHCESAPLMVAS